MRAPTPPRALLVLTVTLALAACGQPPPSQLPPGPDGGQAVADAGHLPADAGSDAGTQDAGYAWDLPGVEYFVDEVPPFTAPSETWTFIPVPEAKCGNGSSTGMAVNLTQRSRRLLLFLAGGGACWEAAACAAGTAVHLQDDMGEAAVLGEARAAGMAPLFDRTNPANPFRDASFVYVPYCTGDLHGGTRVHTYDWFGPRPVHHTGASNMHFYLRLLRATFPQADRVWLAGISAGGFGATLNWWRAQKVLPWARVDVFNDSGLVIDPAGDGRYATMRSTWGLVFPPGCTDCETRLSAALSRSAELLPAPRRYAVLGYLRDQVIANYWGLSADQVEQGVRAMKESAAPNVRTFLLGGGEHVIYDQPSAATSTGQTARQWATSFAGDDPSWGHAGP